MKKPRSPHDAEGGSYALPQCSKRRACTIPGADTVAGRLWPCQNFTARFANREGRHVANSRSVRQSRRERVPRGDIEGLLDRNPAFARHLIRMLIGKVRTLTQKVLDLALKDVYGRFAKFIDENAVEEKGMRVVSERLTQHDIAARIGGSREMVNRIVKDLTAGGYISVDAKQITVHKKLPSHW